MDDVATTNLMKSTHKWMKYLENVNTPFPRVCEIKYLSCELEALDSASSGIDELVKSQVDI